MSGVVVPSSTKSISAGLILFLAIKSSAALMARKDVPFVSSFRMRLSLIPVREVIHSSLVSTNVSSTLFESTKSGT
ncbi:hypothetical protein D3C72_533460 [compost metagenome]